MGEDASILKLTSGDSYQKKIIYYALEMGTFMICKIYLTKTVLRNRDGLKFLMWQEDKIS